jgi:hypothetical protein
VDWERHNAKLLAHLLAVSIMDEVWTSNEKAQRDGG